MENLHTHCTLCPRRCGIDRTSGETGYCGETEVIRVARAALHQWEEPCLTGAAGSGTVFFAGCSLKCVYCQNYRLAHGEAGKPVTVGRLAAIFLELQAAQAQNINLVTPTHYALPIIEAVAAARRDGLKIPIVYNTSGYETTDTLRRLMGTVDIYLPDFKYVDPNLSRRYSHAPDYFPVAAAALEEMVRQQPQPVFDAEGMMQRGVIVRHLALPGSIGDSKRVIQYLFSTYGTGLSGA